MIDAGVAAVCRGPASGPPYQAPHGPPRKAGACEASRTQAHGPPGSAWASGSRHRGAARPRESDDPTGSSSPKTALQPASGGPPGRHDPGAGGCPRPTLPSASSEGHALQHAVGPQPGAASIGSRWGIRRPWAPPLPRRQIRPPCTRREGSQCGRHAHGALATGHGTPDYGCGFSGQVVEGNTRGAVARSRTYSTRFMLRLDSPSETKLQHLMQQFGASKATIIHQLLVQATPEDVPTTWQMRAAERPVPPMRQPATDNREVTQ